MSGETTIRCRQCGGEMHHKTRVERNWGLQLLGVVLALFGLGLLVTTLPAVLSSAQMMDTDVGAAMMVPSLIGLLFAVACIITACRMGHRKRQIWHCEQCGYFFERQ